MLYPKWFYENGETAKGQQTLRTLLLFFYLLAISFTVTPSAEIGFYWNDMTIYSCCFDCDTLVEKKRSTSVISWWQELRKNTFSTLFKIIHNYSLWFFAFIHSCI